MILSDIAGNIPLTGALLLSLATGAFAVPMDYPAGIEKANDGFKFNPAKVTAPALIIVGEGEYKSAEVRRQQDICLKGLANPRKKLVVTPENEGASNHCIMENRSLMAQEVFDWLDETFR